MTMTGGIAFYDKNFSAYGLGARMTASSNDSNADLALGRDEYFKWESSGSDDTTQETLTLTLPNATTVSRLFMIGHNFKDFEISATGASITGLNSGFNNHNNGTAAEATLSGGDIDQNGYDTDVSYFEFDPIEVTEIVITCTTAQVADAQKYLSRLIVTNELGTLRGYPETKGVNIDPNEKEEKTIAGFSHIERGVDTADFSLSLKSYPYQDDVDLLDDLFARYEPFMVWLCGGLPDQFGLNLRGWRSRDLYLMKVDGGIQNGFSKNTYCLGKDGAYRFREVLS